MTITSSDAGKIYSFETQNGARYKNLKLVAVLDAATVMQLGFDAPARHQQMMPYMPAGTPTSYTSYMYAKFIDTENNATYLGLPWIKESSMVENTSPDYRITLRNPTPDQVESVRSMMVASGIENFIVEKL